MFLPVVLLQGWLSLESAGAKRLYASLASPVLPDDVLKIICAYYTVTKEELKRRIVLSAAEEVFVAQICLTSTVVTHEKQMRPGQSNASQYVKLETLRPGQYVGLDTIDLFLRLIEEQSRTYAAVNSACVAGTITIPTIGVLPIAIRSTNGVLPQDDIVFTLDKLQRANWFTWCAARNSVVSALCLDLIMWPLCYAQHFYALGVINCRKRCIQVYHTLNRTNINPFLLSVLGVFRKRCEIVAKYLQLEFRGYAQYEEYWEVIDVFPENELAVRGTSLCESGVSMCMQAYHLALGLVPDFTREAFPEFRRRMIRDLLVPNDRG